MFDPHFNAARNGDIRKTDEVVVIFVYGTGKAVFDRNDCARNARFAYGLEQTAEIRIRNGFDPSVKITAGGLFGVCAVRACKGAIDTSVLSAGGRFCTAPIF